MDLSRYAELFRAETREHLGALNQLLLDWERAPDDPAPVHGIFRAVHTIKGMAATMGYAALADLAHRAENLLDHFRQENRAVTPEVIELLFRTADGLEELVESAATGGGAPAGEEVGGLVEALDEAARGLEPTGAPDAPRRRISFVSAPAGVGHKVQVVIRADSVLKGARALVALKRAEAIGTVHAVEPAPGAIESEEFDGRFAFRLETQHPPDAIEREIRLAGDIDRVAVDADDDVAVVERAAGRTRHIRVDLRRLDRLMNLAGELVTARGRLGHLGAVRGDPALTEAVEDVSRLTVDLQSEILEARMTPVWQVFDRFPRLVRDLGRQLGKRVEFHVEGKDIEIDRAVLDELGDPLVHLLRNAVDHGIERPEEREAAGKPATGQIVLSALRERAAIAIVVRDDGRGLDRAKILAQAKRLGVVDEEVETLTDDLLVRVLSRAGFSMAREVSDVSGRGVGVDVVATRIRGLGGSVEVRSEIGGGTTFTLRVPVTLAIIRALLARVGTEQYALPLTHVAETVELSPSRIADLEGREALQLRDDVVPLVHLRDIVGAEGAPPSKRPVIVVRIGERRSGLVVDHMVGQQEIVVKPFEAPQGTLPIFSGATILGDGSPVLILDAGGLV